MIRMIVKKSANGSYYLFNKQFKKTGQRNIFLIKNNYNGVNGGRMLVGYIHFPKDLLGKRIRLKIEVEE